MKNDKPQNKTLYFFFLHRRLVKRHFENYFEHYKKRLKGLKEQQFTLEIVNLAGRTIYSSKGKGDTVLDLMRLRTEAGTYIVRLTTARYVLTERLMVF